MACGNAGVEGSGSLHRKHRKQRRPVAKIAASSLALAIAVCGGVAGLGTAALWAGTSIRQPPHDAPREPLVAGRDDRVSARTQPELPRDAQADLRTSTSPRTTRLPIDPTGPLRLKPAPTTAPSGSGEGERSRPARAGGAARAADRTSGPEGPRSRPDGGAGDPAPGSPGTPRLEKYSGSADAREPEQPPSQPAPDARARELVARVVALTNAARARAGCDPVHADTRLRRAAEGHSADMARRGYFSHTSPDGHSPWDRAEAAGYGEPSGENIARGYDTAKAAVDGWMDSEAHRENILNCDSEAIGVGVHTGGEKGPYWTQLFGYE